MRLKNIKSKEKRARFTAKQWKSLTRSLRRRQESQPILIAGMQRSGTTMMMDVFHFRKDVGVFDEARNSPVFEDFRIRSLSVLKASLGLMRLPFSVYKIICDSHQIDSFLDGLPGARVVWVYRDPVDNAASQMKKFAQPVAAVRKVAKGEEGGGWLAEGVSPEAMLQVQSLPYEELSDFDWCGVNWWLRNLLFFENRLETNDSVLLLRYEDLARNPLVEMRRICDFCQLPEDHRSLRFVHSRSVRKAEGESFHPAVASLCAGLLEQLDKANRKHRQATGSD